MDRTLGLLFGVPRTLARGQTGASSAPGSSAPASSSQLQGQPASSSRVNTNLEDISDWLTKTIVGVGLTQLFSVPRYLWHVAAQVNANGFGWNPYGQLLALALFLYFAPGGFWLGYVGTRTVLTKLFELIEGPQADIIDRASDPKNLHLDISGRRIAPADQNLAPADSVLLRTPIEALTSPRQVAAWGAAQARAGNLYAAQAAFEEVVRRQPANPDAKQQLATVYSALGRFAEAAPLVRDLPSSPIAVFNALYEPRPQGFEKAIAIGEALEKDPEQAANAQLHVWLACAYGQQYGYEKGRNASETILAPMKKKMLQEIVTATQLDPKTRDILRSVWRPAPGAEDNDLAAFAPDDPELVPLLGAP